MTTIYMFLTVCSVALFAYYGIASLISEDLIGEFDRWGMSGLRRVTATLELAGALGLLIGLIVPVIALMASAGLCLMMVLATGVLVLQGHTFGLQGSLEYALVRQFAKRYIYQHGIDFNEALELWNDPYMIEWPARSTGESRRAITGVARGKLWMAIMRLRGDVDWRPPDRNIASNGPTLAPIRHNSSAFPHLSRM